MVVRKESKNRRYLGSRRWGAGNIKNRRGKGSRGGVGKSGKKHWFTYIVKYAPERIRQKGFSSWNKKVFKEINLDKVSKLARNSKDAKPTIELRGFKVLGNGSLAKPAVVKASAFSKSAEEKIKSAGGEAHKF